MEGGHGGITRHWRLYLIVLEAVCGERVTGSVLFPNDLHWQITHQLCQWGCDTWAVTDAEVKPALAWPELNGKVWSIKANSFITSGALKTKYRAETRHKVRERVGAKEVY